MRRQLAPALRAILVLTVLTGVLYPLVVLAIGQVAFHRQAEGSLVTVDGQVVGSELLGQVFTGDRYLWPRPSAAGALANGSADAPSDDLTQTVSGGSNLGPTNPALIDGNAATGAPGVAQRVAAYRAANHLAADQPVPVDAVTASASGLDPHISVANARLQAPRVAAARAIPVGQVQAAIDQATEQPDLGVFGEPGVNVLRANLLLDGKAA